MVYRSCGCPEGMGFLCAAVPDFRGAWPFGASGNGAGTESGPASVSLGEGEGNGNDGGVERTTG